MAVGMTVRKDKPQFGLRDLSEDDHAVFECGICRFAMRVPRHAVQEKGALIHIEDYSHSYIPPGSDAYDEIVLEGRK